MADSSSSNNTTSPNSDNSGQQQQKQPTPSASTATLPEINEKEYNPTLQDVGNHTHSLLTNCRPLTEFISLQQLSTPPGLKIFFTVDRVEGMKKILARIDRNVRYFEGNYAIIFLGLFFYFAYQDPILKWHLVLFLGLTTLVLLNPKPTIEVFHPFKRQNDKNLAVLLFQVSKTRLLMLVMLLCSFLVYKFCFSSFVRCGGLSSCS